LASLQCYLASLYLPHAGRGIVSVFNFAVVVFGFALISSRPVWYHCGIRLRCGSIRLRPNLLHTQYDIVAVFDFTVAVFGFALISSRPAWYRCGIRLRCGGIGLRPNLLHPRRGIVAVTLGCFTNGTIAQVVTNSLSPLSGQHLYDGSGATV